MAQHFLASIYTVDNGYDAPTQLASMGVLNSFSPTNTRFYPARAGTTGGSPTTVNLNAIIEIAPNGLNVKAAKYYTDQTVSALNTAANA
jgi:hypothetical protein